LQFGSNMALFYDSIIGQIFQLLSLNCLNDPHPSS
jgi:hypothetical protein